MQEKVASQIDKILTMCAGGGNGRAVKALPKSVHKS